LCWSGIGVERDMTVRMADICLGTFARDKLVLNPEGN
jgi:hypothetical protein